MQMTNPIVLDELLTNILGPEYVNWEPETLEAELSKLNHNVLSQYGSDDLITNMINAMRAVKSDKSYALQEWHLLEKCLAALTGKRVLVFDAQPPAAMHELFLGVEILKGLVPDLKANMSEETLMYIGINLLNMGVLAFPFEPYDACLAMAITGYADDVGAMAQVKDFEKKLNGFIAKPEVVSEFMSAIEADPNTDLLKNIKSINLFNAITAVCSYIIIRGFLTDHENSAEAVSNNIPERELESVPAAATTESEGISPELIDEVLRLVKNDTQQNFEKTAAGRMTTNSGMPRSGTYITTPEPDMFTNDNTYEGSNAIPGGSRGSFVSHDNGEDNNEPFDSSKKSVKALDAKKVLNNIKTPDAIAKIFADLDF